jgi:type IV fimbrial biogenesis protein FimT
MMTSGLLRDAKGFTLIEMVVVGAIVGITTMIAIPSFTQWKANYQMKQAATEVAGNLNLARAAAMSRGAGITVTTDMVYGKPTVKFGGVFPPVTLNEGVANISAANFGFNMFGLRAGGGSTDTLITLTPTQGTVYSVAVTPSGKVDWCPKATCP